MSAIADVKMNSIPSFIIDPPTPHLSRVESNFAPESLGKKVPGHQTGKSEHFNNYKKKLLLAAAISNHSLLHMTNSVPTIDDLSPLQQQARCNQDNSITTTKSPQNCQLKRFYQDGDLSPPPKRSTNFASLSDSPSLAPNGSTLLATTTVSQNDWLTNYRVATLASPLEEVMPPASPLAYEITASKPLDLAIKNKTTDLPASTQGLTRVSVDKIGAKSKLVEDSSPRIGLDFPQMPLLHSSPRLIEKAKGYWKEFITKVLDARKEEEQEEREITREPYENQLHTANLKKNISSSTPTTLTAPIDGVKRTANKVLSPRVTPTASPSPHPNQFLVSTPSDTNSPPKSHHKFEDKHKPQYAPLADPMLHHPYATGAALYYYQQQQQYLMNMFQQHNLLNPTSSFLGTDALASSLYPSALLTTPNPYYYMLGQMGTDALPTFQHHYQPNLDFKHLPIHTNPGSGTNRLPCKNSPPQPLNQLNPNPDPLATNANRRVDNVLHAHLTKSAVAQKQQQQQQQAFFDFHHARAGPKLSPTDDSLSHLSSTYSGPYSSNKSNSSVCGDEKYPPKQDPNTSPNDVLTNDSAVDLTFNEEEGHRKSNSSSKDSYLDCGEALNLSKKRELPPSRMPEKCAYSSTKTKNVMTRMDEDRSPFVGKKEKMNALSALEKDKLEALALYNKLAETSSNEGVMTDADKNMVRQWNGTEDFLWEDVKYRRKSASSTSFYHKNHGDSRNGAPKKGTKGPLDLNTRGGGDREENELFSPYDLDDENDLEDCKSFQAQQGRPCNKDQRMALALSLPFSIEDIVTSPIDSFSEILRKADLSIEQVGLVRDIRRRGKNKIAAQNCRRRKLDLIMYLGKNVDYLKATRGALLEEREDLEKEIIDYHIKLENLYLETFKSTKESCETSAESRIIPENYMFQFVDKSKGNLIPQKSNMPAYVFTWEKNLRR